MKPLLRRPKLGGHLAIVNGLALVALFVLIHVRGTGQRARGNFDWIRSISADRMVFRPSPIGRSTNGRGYGLHIYNHGTELPGLRLRAGMAMPRVLPPFATAWHRPENLNGMTACFPSRDAAFQNGNITDSDGAVYRRHNFDRQTDMRASGDTSWKSASKRDCGSKPAAPAFPGVPRSAISGWLHLPTSARQRRSRLRLPC